MILISTFDKQSRNHPLDWSITTTIIPSRPGIYNSSIYFIILITVTYIYHNV